MSVIGGQQLYTRHHVEIDDEVVNVLHGLMIGGRALTEEEAAQILVIPLPDGADGTNGWQSLQMTGEPTTTGVEFLNTAFNPEAPLSFFVNVAFLLPHTVIGNPGDCDDYQPAP